MQHDAHRSAWANYQAAWSNVGADERQHLLTSSVAEDCIYTDPAGVRHGHEALITYLEQFQQRLPSAYFENNTFRNCLKKGQRTACCRTSHRLRQYGRGKTTSDAARRRPYHPRATLFQTVSTEHHEQALASWTRYDAQGDATATGTSYARFGEDGRLTHMTGFPDPAPNAG